MGKTIAEKIFSEKSQKDVRAGDYVVADVDFTVSHDGNRPLAIEKFLEMGGTKVFDPMKNAQIIDHAPSSPTDSTAAMQRKLRDFAGRYGVRFHDIGDGSCHQLVPEMGYVKPGDLVVGTDSHTCTYGALNVFSTGIGSSDMACAMMCGKLWFRVPESIKFVLNGKLPAGVYSKDLILHMIGLIRADGATYKSVEYTGPAISELSVDARMTISNMAIEMGGKAGLMEADDKTRAWLREHGVESYTPVSADPDAVYSQVIEIDVGALSPQIAKPHWVDNVATIEEIEDTPVHEAIIGACTNGRLEDLRIGAEILKGRRVKTGTRLFVVPASRSIYRQALAEGIIDTYLAAGGVVGIPGCSGCSGGANFACPGNGENVITTANRNFKGRLANPNAFMYLASPATVAASAVCGRIADCREFLGKDV